MTDEEELRLALNDIVSDLYVAFCQEDRDRWRNRVRHVKTLDREDQWYIRNELDAALQRRAQWPDLNQAQCAQVEDEAAQLAEESRWASTMPLRTGVRFSEDGITEQALKKLARKPPRGRRHHYDLALKDLQAAVDRIPLRKEALQEAERQALVANDVDQDKAQRNVAQATLDLALAERAVKVCESKLQTRTDPKTGKPRAVSGGRAPHWMAGAQDQLDREYEARARLAEIEAFMAMGKQLPELESSEQQWHRLKFAYYVDCPAHMDARHDALPVDIVLQLDADVQAFCLYAHRETAKNGIPVLIFASQRTVRVEHALWRDRLTEADASEIATFVRFASSKLQLRLTAIPSTSLAFMIERPAGKGLDYGEICRRIRRHNWRAPFDATDEKLFENLDDVGSVDGSTSQSVDPDKAARMAADRDQVEFEKAAYEQFMETGIPVPTNPKQEALKPWSDPMPRLASSGLPWALTRLFRKVRRFHRIPAARLGARTPGPAWYTPVGSHVASPQIIAGELFNAIWTGDVDAVIWWYEEIFPVLHDDVIREALSLTDKMVGES